MIRRPSGVAGLGLVAIFEERRHQKRPAIEIYTRTEGWQRKLHIPSDAMYNASVLSLLPKGFHRPPSGTFRHPDPWWSPTRYRLSGNCTGITNPVDRGWENYRQIVVLKILCNIYKRTRVEFWISNLIGNYCLRNFHRIFLLFFFHFFLILDTQILKDRIFLLNYFF